MVSKATQVSFRIDVPLIVPINLAREFFSVVMICHSPALLISKGHWEDQISRKCFKCQTNSSYQHHHLCHVGLFLNYTRKCEFLENVCLTLWLFFLFLIL